MSTASVVAVNAAAAAVVVAFVARSALVPVAFVALGYGTLVAFFFDSVSRADVAGVVASAAAGALLGRALAVVVGSNRVLDVTGASGAAPIGLVRRVPYALGVVAGTLGIATGSLALVAERTSPATWTAFAAGIAAVVGGLGGLVFVADDATSAVWFFITAALVGAPSAAYAATRYAAAAAAAAFVVYAAVVAALTLCVALARQLVATRVPDDARCSSSPHACVMAALYALVVVVYAFGGGDEPLAVARALWIALALVLALVAFVAGASACVLTRAPRAVERAPRVEETVVTATSSATMRPRHKFHVPSARRANN